MKTTRLRIVERLASALPVLVGAVVLLGWLLNMPALKSVFPGMAAMQVTTALCFILSGVAFWLGVPEMTTGKAKLVAILTGGLTLVEYLFRSNLGLNEATATTSFGGRMPANTALAFEFLSIAFLLLVGGSRRGFRAAVDLLRCIDVAGVGARPMHRAKGGTADGY